MPHAAQGPSRSADAGGDVVIRPLGRPGDLGWVVMAHGEAYAAEFGWDATFEALVAGIVGEYAAGRDAHRETAWVAELDGRRVGCVFCVDARLGAGADGTPARPTAQLRLLLVLPEGRGLGLGGRLVDTCLAFAGERGYERMTLWTNDPLAAARHVYLARGFRLTDEQPHDSFGHAMVGQTYELDLPASADLSSATGPPA